MFEVVCGAVAEVSEAVVEVVFGHFLIDVDDWLGGLLGLGEGGFAGGECCGDF